MRQMCRDVWSGQVQARQTAHPKLSVGTVRPASSSRAMMKSCPALSWRSASAIAHSGTADPTKSTRLHCSFLFPILPTDCELVNAQPARLTE
jgi:hypothetical protein